MSALTHITDRINIHPPVPAAVVAASPFRSETAREHDRVLRLGGDGSDGTADGIETSVPDGTSYPDVLADLEALVASLGPGYRYTGELVCLGPDGYDDIYRVRVVNGRAVREQAEIVYRSDLVPLAHPPRRADNAARRGQGPCCDCGCPRCAGTPRVPLTPDGCHCAVTCAAAPITLLARRFGTVYLNPGTGRLECAPLLRTGLPDWDNAGEVDSRADDADTAVVLERLLWQAAAALRGEMDYREPAGNGLDDDAYERACLVRRALAGDAAQVTLDGEILAAARQLVDIDAARLRHRLDETTLLLLLARHDAQAHSVQQQRTSDLEHPHDVGDYSDVQ